VGRLSHARPAATSAGGPGAGLRANATLIATLSDIADSAQRAEEFFIRLRSDVTSAVWKTALADVLERLCLPAVDDKAWTA
jgi:ATP-dependent helicase Lhr and Lhr-like helicase